MIMVLSNQASMSFISEIAQQSGNASSLKSNFSNDGSGLPTPPTQSIQLDETLPSVGSTSALTFSLCYLVSLCFHKAVTTAASSLFQTVQQALSGLWLIGLSQSVNDGSLSHGLRYFCLYFFGWSSEE